MNTELKKHYKKIWALIKAEEPMLPARLAGLLPGSRPWNAADRPGIILYMQNLPHPSTSSDDYIRKVFQEIQTGKLEWAFNLPYEGKSLGLFLRGL